MRHAMDGGFADPEHREELRVVVLVASLGGLGPLRSIAGLLPPDLPAAVLVVLHRSPHSPALLAALLRASSGLPVVDARPCMLPLPGRIHVAPSWAHLRLTSRGRFTFDRTGRIGYVSSAGDPLLESAAALCGSRVLAVILTGRGHDGTAGARAVKQAGGTVLVQDPATARARAMPESAIAAGIVDGVHTIAGLAAEIDRCARQM